MSKTPTCARCGRPLKDPVSIALGIGAECRKSKTPSRRQASHARLVARGQAFADRNPIAFVNVTYTHTGEGWNDGKRTISNERFGKWLMENNLIILPQTNENAMSQRRDVILQAFTLQPPLPQEEILSLYDELVEINRKLQDTGYDDITDALREQKTGEQL